MGPNGLFDIGWFSEGKHRGLAKKDALEDLVDAALAYTAHVKEVAGVHHTTRGKALGVAADKLRELYDNVPV